MNHNASDPNALNTENASPLAQRLDDGVETSMSAFVATVEAKIGKRALGRRLGS